jgi:hypothetical protein
LTVKSGKYFQLTSRVDHTAKEDIGSIDGTTHKPVHFVEVTTPRGFPTRFDVWVEITQGGSTLLKFPDRTADPEKWDRVFLTVEDGSPGVHREPLEAQPSSGPAAISVVNLTRLDHWGIPKTEAKNIEVDVQVN